MSAKEIAGLILVSAVAISIVISAIKSKGWFE